MAIDTPSKEEKSVILQRSSHELIDMVEKGISEFLTSRRKNVGFPEKKFYNEIFSPFYVILQRTSNDDKLSKLAEKLILYYFDKKMDPYKDNESFIKAIYEYQKTLYATGKVSPLR